MQMPIIDAQGQHKKKKTERKKENDANLFKFVGFIQIWYFSTAEDVADIFKERLFQSLGVVKQEHCGLVLHTSQNVQALQIYELNYHWH